MSLEFDPVTGSIIVPKFEGLTTEDNIVFKCNWNDNGWKGICSKKAREFNVLKKHSWCCDKRNPCSEMIEKHEKGFPCIESVLFVDFKLDPGMYLKGEKSGDENMPDLSNYLKELKNFRDVMAGHRDRRKKLIFLKIGLNCKKILLN